MFGICDVIFYTGSTPPTLTIPSTVKWLNNFDPSLLESNSIYELNIMDGTLGVAARWSTEGDTFA